MTSDVHELMHEMKCRIMAARNAVDETNLDALLQFSTLVHGLSLDLLDVKLAVLREASTNFPDDFFADHSLAYYFHFVCKNPKVAREYAERSLERLNVSGERAEDHRAEFMAQELITILEATRDE